MALLQNLLEAQNVTDIYDFFRNEDLYIIQHLQSIKMLRSAKKCSLCKVNTTLSRINKDFKVGFCQYCKKCKSRKSLTDKTFFHGTHLSFEETFVLIWCWLSHIATADVEKLFSIKRQVALQYYKSFRDIASFALLSLPQTMLGGPGHIVQIDHYQLTKEKKIPDVSGKWALVLYDTNVKQGQIQVVTSPTANVVVPLIVQYVSPGSKLWTDSNPVYDSLNNEGYDHHTVNGSNFVASDGTTLNSVKNFWGQLKRYCSKTSVLQSPLIDQHIDEFLYRERFKGTIPERFRKFLEHMAEKYGLRKRSIGTNNPDDSLPNDIMDTSPMTS